MPKKGIDPAIVWALRAFGVVTALATVSVAVWLIPVEYGPAKTIWISLLVGAMLGVLVGGVVYIAGATYLIEKQQRDVRRVADIARALGPRYASIVETTLATVRQDIRNSEAARAGLLGDIDFDADIRGITDNLLKARDLQKVADELGALDKPSADDRKILAEAKATVAKLETAGPNRVELISQCATEAQLVDKSHGGPLDLVQIFSPSAGSGIGYGTKVPFTNTPHWPRSALNSSVSGSVTPGRFGCHVSGTSMLTLPHWPGGTPKNGLAMPPIVGSFFTCPGGPSGFCPGGMPGNQAAVPPFSSSVPSFSSSRSTSSLATLSSL